MSSLVSVAWQAVASPVTTLMLLAMSWIWVKLYLQEWDQRYFTASFTDCVEKKQFWRVVLAPISHNSLFILLLNSVTLWNCRHLEQQHGTLFFLRYSLVLLLSESLIAYSLVYFTIKFSTPTGRSSAGVRQILCNIHTMGSSGFILAWLSFASLDYRTGLNSKTFQLFGLFNFNPTIAPVIMVMVYFFCLPRNYAYSNLGGIFSGYLLKLRVLEFLPGWYWSLCFLINIALLTIASILLPREMRAVDGNDWIDDTNTEYIEVDDISFGIQESDSNNPSSTAVVHADIETGNEENDINTNNNSNGSGSGSGNGDVASNQLGLGEVRVASTGSNDLRDILSHDYNYYGDEERKFEDHTRESSYTPASSHDHGRQSNNSSSGNFEVGEENKDQ